MSVSACLHIRMYTHKSGAHGHRGRLRILWGQSYKWLRATIGALETKSRSFERTVNALNG